MIQSNFVDMEKMLSLLEERQTVQDAPDATDLVVKEGHVVFGMFSFLHRCLIKSNCNHPLDNVSFSYDSRQPALNGISFSIPKGATVALVGPSGGG